MHKPCVISALAAAVVLSLAGARSGMGQQTEARRRGVGDTSVFAPINVFPAPNSYRTAGGAPGSKYWQSRADYDLHATLDTTLRSISGTMTLRYTNNSPDTLPFIWVQLDQNMFRDGSLTAMVFQQSSTPWDFHGGDVIDRFEQVVGGKKIPVKLRDNGTTAKVELVRPLAPGESATLEAAWHFLVPDHGAIRLEHNEVARRMVRQGTLYEVAQWYPRVCVYDDVHGWNTDPYLGHGEFYLEYGDFTLSVTVPAGYVVAATGTLDNPNEVLTSAEIDRLAKASKSATPVAIVTGTELISGAARPKQGGTLTWKFHAKNVRDVAWAGSPEYQWDASSWNGILAQSYYRPSADTTWGNGDAADMARMSIQEYSERWFQYPYPQISVVEGLVFGMEYPMLAMESKSKDKYDLYAVLTHEVGHNWFPMIVGSNERMHFWQDEGLNTFINSFSEALRYPDHGDQIARIAKSRTQIEQTQIRNIDIPVEMQPDRMDPVTGVRGFTSYGKPAVGLQLLREEILGPDAFDDAFRTYIKRWAYKHPTPADFFRTMENVGGRRLDWFWREWFYEDTHFDQAIDTVATRADGDTLRMAVRYRNDARGVLPIIARFSFSDGSTKDFVYPAEVWSVNTRYYIRNYSFGGKKVTRIDLDPDHRLLDIDRTNNSWVAKTP